MNYLYTESASNVKKPNITTSNINTATLGVTGGMSSDLSMNTHNLVLNPATGWLATTSLIPGSTPGAVGTVTSNNLVSSCQFNVVNELLANAELTLTINNTFIDVGALETVLISPGNTSIAAGACVLVKNVVKSQGTITVTVINVGNSSTGGSWYITLLVQVLPTV